MHPDALKTFQALCDLDDVEPELRRLDPQLAADVRRLLQADRAAGEGDLRVSAAPALLAHVVAEISADDAEDQGPVPPRIGAYRPVERLGGGATSHVYLAWQAAPRRLVALKIVRRGVPAAVAARFQGEAQALADLRVAAAPQVYEVGSHEGRPFLAMERVVGHPAGTWAKGRPPEQVADLVARVAEAVQAAHDAGLVHRDLKPEHILVQDDGAPRLLDFGLSAGDAEGLGTPLYMPPEALRGEAVGPASDTYALGVTLLELLAGGLPDSWSAPDRRLPARLPGVSEELAAVIRHGVHPDPARRYPTAGLFADDLRRAIAHVPVHVLPSTWRRTARLAVLRHRRTLSRAGAAALGLCVLVAAALAVRAGLEARAAVAREASAATVAAQLAERVGELRDQGRDGEASALLDSMATTPPLQGSEALARLWMREARARTGPSALAALVAATEHPATRLDALRALAARFHAGAQPGPLAAVARMSGDPAWTAVADRWTRVVTPTGPMASVLARLATGQRTAVRARSAMVGTLDGAPTLGWAGANGVGASDLRPDLPVRWSTELPSGPGFLPAWLEGPEGLELLVGQPDDGLAALRPPDEAPTRLGTVQRPMSWTWGRTHPGAPRLYVGAGPWARRLYEVTPGRPPREPDPRTSGSDVNALAAADLNGDGYDELIGAIGPWMGYELRVWTADGDGLRPLARRVTGNVDALTLLPGPDGVDVVAAKSDRYPHQFHYADAGPFGPPAGLYVLRLSGVDWTQRAFAPLPFADPGLGAILVSVTRGDVDGDGRDELYAGVEVGVERLTWIVDPARPDDGVLIGGTRPLATADLDGDGRDELLVSLPDRDDEVWALGVGADALPPGDAREVTVAPPGTLPPVAGLERAATLARLGLFEDAAARVEAACALAPPAVRGALWAWVARLRAAAGQPREAALAWRRASEGGDVDTLRAAREAARVAHDPALVRAADVALGGAVEPEGPTRLTHDRARWVVEAPEAVRRWDTTGLGVDVFASHGDVLRAPLTPTGPLVLAESTWEVTDLDPYGSASLTLRRGDAEAAYAGVIGTTGGSRAFLRLRCGQGIHHVMTPEHVQLPLREPVRFTVRVGVDVERGSAYCAIHDASGAPVLQDTRPLPPGDGPITLVLRAHTLDRPDMPGLASARVRQDIDEVVVWGATADGGQDPDHPAQAWLRGDTDGALRAWTDSAPQLAAWAAFERGRPEVGAALVATGAPCCLPHRLSRLQPWGYGARLAALQGSSERLAFLVESLHPNRAWSLEGVAALLDPRLDHVEPHDDEQFNLLVARAMHLHHLGHEARALTLLLRLVERPLSHSILGRTYHANAAHHIAQIQAHAGADDDARRWMREALLTAPNPAGERGWMMQDAALKALLPDVLTSVPELFPR